METQQFPKITLTGTKKSAHLTKVAHITQRSALYQIMFSVMPVIYLFN